MKLVKKQFFKASTAYLLATLCCLNLACSFGPDEVVQQTNSNTDIVTAASEVYTTSEKLRIERKARKAKKAYTNPGEAQEFFLDQRTGGAPLDYTLLQQAKIDVQSMPTANLTAKGFEMNEILENGMVRDAGDISGWLELGPGNIGGRTRAVLLHPTNDQIMYAAGVAGGVWYSSNAGAAWNPLDDLMSNLAVTSLAFAGQGGASVNTSILYAATGEGFYNADSVRGGGIFKSTDSGTTWSQLASTANSSFYYVNKIVASPNNVNVLYAATRTGIWKTSDAGTSWTNVLSDNGAGGSSGTQVNTYTGFTDVEIRTDLATDTLIASNGSLWSGDGIYRSLDAGVTWARVHTATDIGRSDLAIAPSNQATMYAMSSDRNNSYRLLNVYRSTDGGATWTAQIAGAYDAGQINWQVM
ncbi:MAG: sialidase family protein, partial [Candidatus Hydrogenedentota bacterium]